jgi:hypothetical protein
MLLAAAGIVASAFVSAVPASAKAPADPACKPTRWTLAVPAGMSEAETQIVEVPEDHIWRVAANGVPADAMLIIEYKKQVGTKGEVVLNAGGAELVEGTTVSVQLRRTGGKMGAVQISGNYNMKCGK